MNHRSEEAPPKSRGKVRRARAIVLKHDHVVRDGFGVFHEMQLTDGVIKDPKWTETKIFFVSGAVRASVHTSPHRLPPRDVTSPCVSYSGERFLPRAIWQVVKFTKGEDMGPVGYNKTLDGEDVAFINKRISTFDGSLVILLQGTSINFYPHTSCTVRTAGHRSAHTPPHTFDPSALLSSSSFPPFRPLALSPSRPTVASRPQNRPRADDTKARRAPSLSFPFIRLVALRLLSLHVVVSETSFATRDSYQIRLRSLASPLLGLRPPRIHWSSTRTLALTVGTVLFRLS